MNAALSYPEQNRLTSGLLALTVHAAFLAILMFGLRWQARAPENLAVELWDSLPVVEPIPEQKPPMLPEPIPQPVIKAEPPIALKADIELREKKISKTQVAKPTAKEIKVRRLAEEQRLLEEYAEMRRQSEQVRVRAEQDRVRAEVSAATAAEVGRYQDMIRNKIRRNIVMPPDLEESVTSEFKVTLLPGGMVMEVILMKSSGNPAYDNAAERAIYKSQPLPIPKDTELQKLFRELRLTIRP